MAGKQSKQNAGYHARGQGGSGNDSMFVGMAAVDIAADGPSSPDDPVYAKAIAFRQGRQQAALVVCDLVSVRGDVGVQAREAAARESGIPLENVCLSATHTHSNREQPDDLVERVARAVVQAQAAAGPARLQVGKGYRDDLSFNRRYLMRDGTVMMNPGVLNPDIVRPVGPIDPEIGIILFRDADDKPVASLTSFASHTCSFKFDEHRNKDPYDRRADYAYWLERSLREKFGPDFISVFGEGCCEDVGNIEVNRPHAYVKATRGQFMLTDYVPKETTAPPSPSNARYVGEGLAEEIRAQVARLHDERPALAVRNEVVHVPLATYSDMDLAWARGAKDQEVSWLTQFRIERILALEELRNKYGETLPLLVQVLRLGEGTAVVALPGEVFVEHGLAIKKASPFAHTLPIELCNEREHIASVPLRKSFCEGHFEIVYSRLECGAGEMLVDAAVRMLKGLAV